ncbi:TRNA (guanine(37)-N1)-methyltransferase [Aphelenchoides fujianensis]|nr:TRNA (guanine(37)-N1)-methyltransferase [Aphelenchoides fujianensis]
MSSTEGAASFVPPAAVRGLTEFDRELFRKTIDIPCIRVPTTKYNRVKGAKTLQQLGLKGTAKLNRAVNEENPAQKFCLFDPELLAKNEAAEAEIRAAVRQVADLDVQLETKRVTMEYEDWDVKRCLKAVLPDGLEFSGHTQIGHILHVNLKENLMPYRFVLGRILFDKIPYAKTVVNKVDEINNTFRFFNLELLAGEPDYVAVVSENGLKYKVDFSKYLRENLKLNKVKEKRVEAFTLDGAEFITRVFPSVFAEHARTATAEQPLDFRFVMNLPGMAIRFLSHFVGVLGDVEKSSLAHCTFVVHCHTFVKAAEDHADEWYEQQAVAMAKEQLQPHEPLVRSVRYVRHVAHRKNMYCVCLELPADCLLDELMFGCWRCGRLTLAVRRPPARPLSTSGRRLAWEVPWEYLQVRRKFMEFVANRYRFERVRMLGPDFACLEWLMNCGATAVEMTDGSRITSQREMREFVGSHGLDVRKKKLKPLVDVPELNAKALSQLVQNEAAFAQRWAGVPAVFIRSIDASDSVVADPGFRYLQECRQVEKALFNFCQYFGDIAIDHLCNGRAQVTLKELEIIVNSHITDAAFFQLAKLRSLRRAHFYFNPWVESEALAIRRLKGAIPRCYITYPEAKYFGTGKEKQ